MCLELSEPTRKLMLLVQLDPPLDTHRRTSLSWQEKHGDKNLISHANLRALNRGQKENQPQLS